MAQQFPAVLVTGARQVGKTSLWRRLFPEAGYLTLDYPGYAEAARTTPEDLLDRFTGQLIIDEIQYAPALLRYLKVRIDENRIPGRFLLTGSQTFPLMEGVSESLAGRCGIYHLQTLSRFELMAGSDDLARISHRPAAAARNAPALEAFSRLRVLAGPPSPTSRPSGRKRHHHRHLPRFASRGGEICGLDELTYLFRGGYPELCVGANPEMWFPSYVATYLERDVRNVLRIVDLRDYHRFLRACALRNARVVNYSELARDVDIAPNTARRWLGLLEASGVIALVEPYFGNRTKRLIKSPKLMFLDTGLASFLSGFLSPGALGVSPHVGPLWESHVYGELVRRSAGTGRSSTVHWWRTASGREVDLVVELPGGKIAAIECKWAEDPGARPPSGLGALKRAEAGKVAAGFVVCRTRATYKLADGTVVTDVAGLLERLERMDWPRSSAYSVTTDSGRPS